MKNNNYCNRILHNLQDCILIFTTKMMLKNYDNAMSWIKADN